MWGAEICGTAHCTVPLESPDISSTNAALCSSNCKTTGRGPPSVLGATGDLNHPRAHDRDDFGVSERWRN